MKKRELNPEQAERLSKININELYADSLKDWDVIFHREIWFLYFDNEPTPGDLIQNGNDNNMIKEVKDDGTVYLIKLHK